MMPGETTQTGLDWNRLQGRVLEGGYQLESILSADAIGAAFKVRVLGGGSTNAVAKMFDMELEHAEEQVELWNSTRKLNDRDLLIPLGAGHTDFEGSTVAYLIVERPEEILEGVIRERPLNRDEAGDVLLAAIHGLDELHSHGLVHGSLSPEYIVASRDSIKLSVESVGRRGFAPRLHLREPKYRAPESAGQYVTPEADVWCLGATLIEVLSQQPCGEDSVTQALKLAAPFDSIARRCLDPDPETRPKLGQVEAMFRSNMTASAEPKKVEIPIRAAAAAAAPLSKPAQLPIPRRIAKNPPASTAKTRVPMWTYAAAAAVMVLLALLWIARPGRHAAASPPQATAKTSTQPPKPSAWESKTITPEDAKTGTPPPPAPAQPSGATSTATANPLTPATTSKQQFIHGTVWRVVLYTYARSADATNKATWVNGKYPGLHAEIFSPNGDLYLVVVGGQMSRENAERLRQRVRAMGLPRDSYIQNYKQ